MYNLQCTMYNLAALLCRMDKLYIVHCKCIYFTLLLSWLFAFAGFDFPIRFPVGLALPVRLGRGAVSLFPLIIFA